jgi:hypothetical protein
MGRDARFLAVVALLLIAAVPALQAQSQATTGVIEGTVVDESGAALPGVTVILTNTATNFQKVVVTDATGRFRGLLLPLGPYTVAAGLEGFETVIREGIDLALGATINLDFTLGVSATEEEITVTGAAALIESTRSESQIRIDDMAVEGLPNNGRNFLEFAKLTPGVTIVQGPDGEELSINGQKGINNNVMIDGADFNNPFFGEQRGGQRPAFTFNQDAVKEILIVPDGAPAEFGRSSGGFISVVTKSGTNDYLGSAHVFYQDDSLSEDPQLRGGGTESFDFDRTQVGFTLGGPLKQDRTFFFLAADAQRMDETKQTDPTRIAPEVVAFLAEQGLPNENGPIARTDDGDAYLAKVDHQVSDNSLLTVRWAYHYSRQENGTFDVPSWGVSANATEVDWAHGYTGSFISTISDSLLNEFRAQYAKEWRPRPYEGPNIPGQDRPFPDTAFDFGGGYRIGMPFFIPVEYDDDRIQIVDNISKLKGDHSYKAGIEYNDVTSSQTFIGFANGLYKFSSFNGFRNYVELGPGYVECGDGRSGVGIDCGASGIVGPLLLFLQQAGVGGLTVEEAGTQAIEQQEYALFVQDSWKPTSNLTLDFGLRWEGLDMPDPITPPDEVFFAPFIGQTRDTTLGPMEFPSDGTIPDDMEQWQPRFALAWTPEERSDAVLRFNTGIYHARIPALAIASTRSTNGSVGQTLFAASFFRPPTWPNLLPEAEVGDPFGPSVYVFDKDFQTPRTWSSAISWEQEVTPGYAFLAKLNYAKTDHITRWINNNDPLMGCPWSTGLAPGGANGINCAPDGGLWTTTSNAKSRYWGVTLGINKRYGDNFAFQAYYTRSEDKSDDDNERDPFTIRYANISNLDAEFGLSDRHQENRFNGWLLWTAPYGLNVNVRATYLDAQPLDIDENGDPVQGFPPTQRCVGPCTVGGEVFERNQGEKDNEYMTIDVRVSKDFSVGAYTVEPIFEVFNLTDEANFLVPEVTNLIFNFDGTVRSGAGDPRKFQVGVRFVR